MIFQGQTIFYNESKIDLIIIYLLSLKVNIMSSRMQQIICLFFLFISCTMLYSCPCGSRCTSCNSTNTSSTGCDYGFFVINGTCTPCPGNCEHCISQNICTVCLKCFDDTYLLNNTCILCPHPQCQQCLDGIGCVKCSYHFYMDNGTCKLCHHTCQNCTSNISCESIQSTISATSSSIDVRIYIGIACGLAAILIIAIIVTFWKCKNTIKETISEPVRAISYHEASIDQIGNPKIDGNLNCINGDSL